jgi:2-polyprenyl-3-methyl-5-hydroxy-6-metoxy-1,4-benzoquinol methylase
MADEDTGSRYLYRQEIHGESEREPLQLISAARDVHTIRHLEEIGVRSGWRCIDIGAGGGSIACWLSERVGPTGRVVATDLETAALERTTPAHVEVVRHDILIDELEPEHFDLAHTRYLLIWLPQRAEALRRIVSAVRPGGWVLIGDVDLRPLRPRAPTSFSSRRLRRSARRWPPPERTSCTATDFPLRWKRRGSRKYKRKGSGCTHEGDRRPAS